MKYIRVVECAAQGDGIRLDMLAEDQAVHRFEVSAECAGTLVAELAAQTGKLDVQDKQQQFIRPTGIQTGKTEKGEPLLFLALEGGAELPLLFKPESLSVLISELEGLRSAVPSEPQIRWR